MIQFLYVTLALVNGMCFMLQVGILPTDTYPALVCDIDSRAAVERLYRCSLLV